MVFQHVSVGADVRRQTDVRCTHGVWWERHTRVHLSGRRLEGHPGEKTRREVRRLFSERVRMCVVYIRINFWRELVRVVLGRVRQEAGVPVRTWPVSGELLGG